MIALHPSVTKLHKEQHKKELGKQAKINKKLDIWFGFINKINAGLLRTAFLEFCEKHGLTVKEKNDA